MLMKSLNVLWESLDRFRKLPKNTKAINLHVKSRKGLWGPTDQGLNPGPATLVTSPSKP